MSRVLLLLGIAILLSTVCANASSRSEDEQVLPYVAYHIYDAKRSVQSGPALGVNFAKPMAANLSLAWSLGVVHAYNKSKYPMVIPEFGLSTIYDLDKAGVLNPYLLGGVSAELAETPLVGLDLGAGIRYNVSKTFQTGLALKSVLNGAHGIDWVVSLGLSWSSVKEKSEAVKAELGQTETPRPEEPVVIKEEKAEAVSPNSEEPAVVKEEKIESVTVKQPEVVVKEEETAKVYDKLESFFSKAGKLKRINMNINFDADRDVVKPEYIPILKDYARFLAQHVELKLVINGFTDNTNKPAQSLTLSAQRAAAVAKILVEKYSIDASRIITKGYGEAYPVVANDTPENQALNCRLEANTK